MTLRHFVKLSKLASMAYMRSDVINVEIVLIWLK